MPQHSASFDLTGPHWRFALAVYGAPGVAESCIALQDAFGVDVNVLLISLFSARQGRPPSRDDIAATDAAVEAWRERVVRPLRDIRREMKATEALRHGGDGEVVRGKVKAAELAAEQLQQAILARFVAELPPSSAQAGLAEVAAAVVRFYGGAEAESASTRIAAAVAPIAAAAEAPPA